jgi:threonine-phosphate decarboxylase
MTPTPHGGNPDGVRARLGLGDRPLLDFSASLNPLGPPPSALAAARAAIGRVDRHPEPGCPRLASRLAERHGVPVDRIIVGAGTTELIGLIGQSLREVLALHAQELGDPGMSLAHLVEPSYTEYRRISLRNELRIESWSKHVLGWEQDFLPRSAAGIFWTGHPNNPTGRAWDRDRLLALVDDTQGLLTVVDEAFLPFLPDEAARTLVGAVADRGNLLVLRSLTKIYAMPGLRVGYAVASADMVERLGQFQNPWSVAAPAEAAALAALDEAEYLARTRELIAAEAARLTDHLWDLPGVRPAWPDRRRPATAPPPAQLRAGQPDRHPADLGAGLRGDGPPRRPGARVLRLPRPGSRIAPDRDRTSSWPVAATCASPCGPAPRTTGCCRPPGRPETSEGRRGLISDRCGARGEFRRLNRRRSSRSGMPWVDSRCVT